MDQSERMKTTNRLTDCWYLALLQLFVLLLTGCQDSTSSQIVSGRITFQGQPVAEGDVTFSNPGTGSVAQGSLNAEGSYTLFQTNQVLKPGEYSVTVTPKISYVEVQGEGYEAGELKAVESGGKSIPRIYRNNATTRLRASVTGGEESFDFELQD